MSRVGFRTTRRRALAGIPQIVLKEGEEQLQEDMPRGGQAGRAPLHQAQQLRLRRAHTRQHRAHPQGSSSGRVGRTQGSSSGQAQLNDTRRASCRASCRAHDPIHFAGDRHADH